MVHKWVKYWLLTGLVMVFIQVIVGGITRLTESGLSITKWEIVSGTIPPISAEGWEKEFELYKLTPQYKEVNEGMDLADFKFIYFWEWVHRFWARWMGFVFIFPFLFFVYKAWLDYGTIKRLCIVMLLAILAATLGWIMVASGLVKRPWVNAYKLSFHLCIALAVYAYLLYTYMTYIFNNKVKVKSNKYNVIMNLFITGLWIQLFIGGVMSGMKAGVYFPTWPDMNGEFFPQVILNISEWNVGNFNNYDTNIFLPSLVQFSHRFTAYLLFTFGLYIFIKMYMDQKLEPFRREIIVFLIMLVSQVILGIITLIMCKGEVPILWGVLHQGGALCLLTAAMWLRYKIKLSVI